MLAYLEDAERRKFLLKQEVGSYKLGRSPMCAIQLPQDNTLISKEQAIIIIREDVTVVEGKYVLVDKSTNNNTFVSGRNVRPAENVVLKDLDKISFGSSDQVFFTFRIDETPPTMIPDIIHPEPTGNSASEIHLPPTLKTKRVIGEIDFEEDSAFEEIESLGAALRSQAQTGIFPEEQQTENPSLLICETIIDGEFSRLKQLEPFVPCLLSLHDGRVFPLQRNKISCGAAADCTVVLPDKARIAETQFEITMQEERFALVPVAGETFVNYVAVSNETELENGDAIRVGNFVLYFFNRSHADFFRFTDIQKAEREQLSFDKIQGVSTGERFNRRLACRINGSFVSPLWGNQLFCVEDCDDCIFFLTAHIRGSLSEFTLVAQELRGLFHGVCIENKDLRKTAFFLDAALKKYSSMYIDKQLPIAAVTILIKLEREKLSFLNLGHHLSPVLIPHIKAQHPVAEEVTGFVNTLPLGLLGEIPRVREIEIPNDYLLMLFPNNLPLIRPKGMNADISLDMSKIVKICNKVLENLQESEQLIYKFQEMLAQNHPINVLSVERKHPQVLCPKCKNTFGGGYRFCPYDGTPLS